MLNLRTLVLNADMTPISIFPLHTIFAKDAVTRCLNGTAYVVSEYQRRILTQRIVMNWPAVIAKKEYIRLDRYVPLKHSTLFYRDRGMCQYCGRGLTLLNISMDHVIPTSRNGERTWANVVAACASCNTRKRDSMPVGEWKPKNKPYVPTYWSILKQRRKWPITIGHSSWLDYLGTWQGRVIVKEI